MFPLLPQGTGAGGLDVQQSLNDVAYRLGFANLNDLAMDAESWITVAELFQFADDAVKKLAYAHGVFLVLDVTITVTPGTAVYNLPATHVFTVLAWLVTVSGVQLLRPTPVRSLWSLDANWPTTSGNAVRCSLDAGQVGTITLYPNPLTGGTLNQVCQEMPAAVAQGASALALPTVLVDFFSYAMLAGARGKESESAMPEMANHFKQRCDLYEQVIGHLWGPGQ